MLKFIMLLLVSAAILTSMGCQHHPGSREYSPDKGWVPN
jgi:hypothetical protein